MGCELGASRARPLPELYAGTMHRRAEDDERVLDDQALVARALAHPTHFAPLYQRYLIRVYTYLRTRTRTTEDAADLTQQVFLRAMDALPRYRGKDGEFAAWLFCIARNAATDYHRRQRETVTWDLLPEALHPAITEDLDAGILRREAADRLRDVLRALDPDQRELLALRFAARLSSAEIAVLLGAREGAIKKRLTRLISRVREQYRD
jgi:RNA polymerase sigma-70 factor (ECF subfamily)